MARRILTLLVLILAIHCYGMAQSCVQWVNGISPENSVSEAAEYLCLNGVIPSVQDASIVYNATAKKKDVAKIVFHALFGVGNVPSDYFPTPFIDLSLLPPEYEQACKAMLYLDYGNGMAPFSRDYYFIGADLPFQKKGEMIRALLEAWNVAPDSNNYNPLSTLPSTFYSDVTVNDESFCWIQRAANLGILNNLPQNTCGNTCFQPYAPVTLAQVYVIVHRLMLSHGSHTVNAGDFFYPNNFSIGNLNNKAGIDRAVFIAYEDASFTVPSSGLSLSYAHSYHSDLTELPFITDNYFLNAPMVQTQSVFPLGAGWTHSYNMFVMSIKNFVGGNFNEEKLALRWSDGSLTVYDRLSQTFTTPGIKDQLVILSQTSNGFAQSIEVAKPNGVIFHFELEASLGLLHLTSVRDRNNNSLTLAYEFGIASGNVTPLRLRSVTDNSSPRSIIFSYYPNSNFIQSVADPIGRSIYYTIDQAGNDLSSFTDAKGQSSHYHYDQGAYRHLLSTIQRPKGNVITNTYDKRKLNSSQSGAYAVNVSFTPNYLASSQTSTSQVSIMQNSQAVTTNYNHDSRGNPTSIISATSNVSISYDLLHPDLPANVTDHLTGISQQYLYDNSGNTIYSSTAANSMVIPETSVYNSLNLVTSSTDGNGNTTTYTYDNNGNLIKIEEPDSVITHFTVNSDGSVNQKIDPSGITTKYGYNTYGNLNLISIQGTSITASAQYDGISRVMSITNTKGVRTEYSYDNNSNVTDERFDPSGLAYQTHYTYDENDNLRIIRDPRQLETELVYDFATDDLIQEKYGNQLKQWTYNTDGTVNTYTNKNYSLFQYSYYPLSDITRSGLLQSDGYATYDYYPITKRPYKITRSGYELLYGYDGFQRVASISYNDLPFNTVSYNYDNNGNVTKITYPFNTNWQVNYEWNSNNRLSAVKDWNGQALVQYFYRKNGQLDHEVYGNGIATYYNYDVAGRLDSIYSLTTTGQIVTALGAGLNNAGEHIRESYYVSLTDTSGIITTEPQIPTVYNYTSTNRLETTNVSGYQYDNSGNVIGATHNNAQYSWDERDNLMSRVTGGVTQFYEYDPLENRRKYDTTRYALDILGQSNVLVETDLTGNPKALYVHGLGMACRIDAFTNEVHYYHYDYRGSTVAISNNLQHVVAKYEYEPFGRIVEGKKPNFRNSFTYVGKYGIMADDTDLYFMRARYYQPSIGRFIGEDPVWSNNLFPYADNNPISNIDPKGEYVETALDVASFVYDVGDFIKKPSVMGSVYILADIATTALPFVAGGGPLLRAALHSQDIVAAAEKANKIRRQWIRFGDSGSYIGDFETVSIRWGSTRKHRRAISNDKLRFINKKVRDFKIPGNSWRVQDPGHLHLWRK